MFVTEEQAEIAGLTDLATNLSDGMAVLKPANIARPIATFGALPEDLASVTDHVARYVRRKVWAAKVASGAVINPVAKMLAATVSLHRQYRTDVHEALNHAVKHNEDLKTLLPEMSEQLDTVVRARLEQTTQFLAGAALASLPQLQAAMTRQALTHE